MINNQTVMKPAEIMRPLHRPKPVRPTSFKGSRSVPSTRYSIPEPVTGSDFTKMLQLDCDEPNREFCDLAYVENELHLRNSASSILRASLPGVKCTEISRWSYPFSSNATVNVPKRPKNPMVHDKVFEDAIIIGREEETDSDSDNSPVTCKK